MQLSFMQLENDTERYSNFYSHYPATVSNLDCRFSPRLHLPGFWPGTNTKTLAIADLILQSAGEQAGLPDMAFVGAEKFLKIYLTLYLH